MPPLIVTNTLPAKIKDKNDVDIDADNRFPVAAYIIGSANEIRLSYRDPRVTTWTGSFPLSIGTESWVTAHTFSETDSEFRSALFELNTYQMLFQLYVNGTLAMDVDLEVLSKDYDLKNIKNFHANAWPIYCIKSDQVWHVCPGPFIVDSTVVFKFKATTNNASLEGGMTAWGV